jgi:hypothetical protein
MPCQRVGTFDIDQGYIWSDFMLLRRLLVSSLSILPLALTLFASPALPQTLPVQTLQTNPGQALATQPRPRSVRAVIRNWGLDRQSSVMSFSRGPATPERAEFTALTFTDSTGRPSQIDRLVITRDTAAGANLGRIDIEMAGITGADGTKIARLRLVGVSDGAVSLGVLNTLWGARNTTNNNDRALARNNRSPSAVSFDSLIATDIIAAAPADRADRADIAINELTITDLRINGPASSFGNLSIKNMAYDTNEVTITIASFGALQAQSAFTQLFREPRTTNLTLDDFMSLSLGGIAMDGLSFKYKKIAETAPPLKTITLASLRLGRIGNGFIEAFGFGGLAASGGEGGKAWQAGLSRVNVTGINLGYFKQVGKAIKVSLAQLRVPSRRNEPTSIPASARSTPSSAKVFLKDIQRGGPLDSGVAGFEMADLTLTGAGFNFGIDQIGIRQQLNSDGIITSLNLIPTHMRLTLPLEQPSRAGGSFDRFLTSLGVREFVLRFDGKASFDPQRDVVSVDQYQFELVDWGRLNMNFTMTGLTAFMAETTMDDIMAASMPVKPSANTDAMSQLRQIGAIYKSIAIASGRLEFTDLGGLDKAATIAAVAASPRSPATSISVTAQNRLVTREGWGQKLRNQYGDKTKPLLMRQLSIAIARFLEMGGTLAIEANPPTPITLTSMTTPPTNPVGQWGLKFTNRPSTAAVSGR